MKAAKLYLLTFLLLGVIFVVNAQEPPPPDPNVIPIDGGLSFLIAAAAGLGIKKFNDHKKANKPE